MRLDAGAMREVLSGAPRGVAAGLLRGALRAAGALYALAMRWRNWRYDTGRAAIQRVDVPVISVGNLTLGGTGKTPLVAWLARWLRQRELRVTIVSRGYGSQDGGPNDEALELEQKLADVPHLQNADRAAAARFAVEELACEVIVLDDGFQHRRLARDLDIVLLDALEPLGYGRVFPGGLLREPVEGLRRAGVVVLARADLVEPAAREAIRAVVRRVAPGALWAEAAHVPRGLVNARGDEQPLEVLRGARVGAFCGLGNPEGFRHTLERCGCTIAEFREFPDHHAYTRADVESLAVWAEGLQAALVVCTHKDLVKLSCEVLGRVPLAALAIEVEFLAGREELEARLEGVLSRV